MNTTRVNEVLVQMYDRSVVREYEKVHRGFIFSSIEVVRSDQLENEIVLKMIADKMPDRVLFNGEEYKLIPAKQ